MVADALILAWFCSFLKTGINHLKLVFCHMLLVEKFLLNSDFNQNIVFRLGPGAECIPNAFCI